MLVNAVPEWICSETLELFHTLVDCLMAAAHSVLHPELGLVSNKGSRTLAALGTLSNEAIVGFHAFVFVQPTEKTPSQALDVIVEATRERTFDANDVSRLDANEAPEASFPEFVAAKVFGPVWTAKIDTINRGETVIALVPMLLVLPSDLQAATEQQVSKPILPPTLMLFVPLFSC